MYKKNNMSTIYQLIPGLVIIGSIRELIGMDWHGRIVKLVGLTNEGLSFVPIQVLGMSCIYRELARRSRHIMGFSCVRILTIMIILLTRTRGDPILMPGEMVVGLNNSCSNWEFFVEVPPEWSISQSVSYQRKQILS